MKNKKILFVIIDGLGDRPVKQLKGRTPLEAAKKPNLKLMASHGLCGMQNALPPSVYPTSEETHIALFGYDYKKDYPGRGVLEALGINAPLDKGDLAFRVDFGTVDENLKVIDPRAGNIQDIKDFVQVIGRRKIDNLDFKVYPGLAHRGVLIIKGANLSHRIHSHSTVISDTDPHKALPHKKNVKVLVPQPLESSLAALTTAKALWKYQQEVHQFLKDHPLNKKRMAQGLLPVNYLLTRGCGSYFKVDDFKTRYGLKAACVAGAPLYKGIASFLGMDVIKVKGATGLYNSNYKAKVKAAKKALKKYDFVYLHFKATDTAAEELGDYNLKKKLIERIDKEMGSVRKLRGVITFVSGDHTTACEVKDHVEDPVPFLLYDGGKNRDGIADFGETSCRFGSFKELRGKEIFAQILKRSGRVN
ncbi:MAG: putative 2,3-bisphosphoglycerate-independent phosphoglycerate mutase 1 [candidate division CPR2 bacterium GW2011_GWC1_39_9]|nr:MAG: putative 2,3-bisphosphoglycerate-independent phosphoglycerate mutase 1 [candidate division CPR2 bacterium GW2011_GWC1_39_9]